MVVKVADFPKSSDEQIARQVKAIEEALAECKSGNFETFMLVALTRDGDVLVKSAECDNLVLLAGHVARLQHIIQRRMDQYQ